MAGKWKQLSDHPISPENTLNRPGPWDLYSIMTSLNWKITPRLTFDVTYLFSKNRNPTASPLDIAHYERRDTRDVTKTWADALSWETWDTYTLLSLTYDGDWLGKLELKATSGTTISGTQIFC